MNVWLPARTFDHVAPATIFVLLIGFLMPQVCLGQLTPVESPAADVTHSILHQGDNLRQSPQQFAPHPEPYQDDPSAVASKPIGQSAYISADNTSTSHNDGSATDGTFAIATDTPAPQQFSNPQRQSNTPFNPVTVDNRAHVNPAQPRRIESTPTQLNPRVQHTKQFASPPSRVIQDPTVAPVGFTTQFSDRSAALQRGAGFSRPQVTRQPTGDRRAGQTLDNRPRQNQKRKVSSSAKALIKRFGFNENASLEIMSRSESNASGPVPIRLSDTLTQGQGKANRIELVNQYWETFYDFAQSVSSSRHRDWVNQIRVSKSTDQSTFGVAKSSAENEVSFNRIQFGKSQAKLKSVMGSHSMIVPIDLPTVTMVKTNFQAFKSRGMIPPRLEGIDQTLTELHDLVVDRADTVLMAERSAEQAKKYYQNNQTGIEHLLGAGRAWRAAETDFISSTIEYNKAYADYAMALPYGRAPVEKVVAMLVVPDQGKPVDLQSSSVVASRRHSGAPSRRDRQPLAQPSNSVRAASTGFDRPQKSSRALPQGTSDFGNRPTGQASTPSLTNRPSPSTSLGSRATPGEGATGFASQTSPTTRSAPQRGANALQPVNARTTGSGSGFDTSSFPRRPSNGLSKPSTQPRPQTAPVRPATPPARSGFKPSSLGNSSASASTAPDVSSSGFSAPPNRKPTANPFGASSPAKKTGGGFAAGGTGSAGNNANDIFESAKKNSGFSGSGSKGFSPQ